MLEKKAQTVILSQIFRRLGVPTPQYVSKASSSISDCESPRNESKLETDQYREIIHRSSAAITLTTSCLIDRSMSNVKNVTGH